MAPLPVSSSTGAAVKVKSPARMECNTVSSSTCCCQSSSVGTMLSTHCKRSIVSVFRYQFFNYEGIVRWISLQYSNITSPVAGSTDAVWSSEVQLQEGAVYANFHFPLPACNSAVGNLSCPGKCQRTKITLLSSHMGVCRAPGLHQVHVCHGRPRGSMTAAGLQPKRQADRAGRCSFRVQGSCWPQAEVSSQHHQLMSRDGDVSIGFIAHDVTIKTPLEADAEPGSNQAEAPAVRQSSCFVRCSLQCNEQMAAKTSSPTLLGPAESSCGLPLLL